MPWLVTGSCVRCGACCKPPVVVENPCIERGQDRCLFYGEADNGQRFGYCLIIGRNGQIKNVRDRFDVRITDAQIAWFEHNCPTFPTGNLAELLAALFELPAECTYEVTWVS